MTQNEAVKRKGSGEAAPQPKVARMEAVAGGGAVTVTTAHAQMGVAMGVAAATARRRRLSSATATSVNRLTPAKDNKTEESEFRVLKSLIPGLSDKPDLEEVRIDCFLFFKFGKPGNRTRPPFRFPAGDHRRLRELHPRAAEAALSPRESESVLPAQLPSERRRGRSPRSERRRRWRRGD